MAVDVYAFAALAFETLTCHLLFDGETEVATFPGDLPADPEALARTLSGGNQQKVVLARALAMAKSLPKVLIAAQPTRGVDIGAIETIHKTLLAAKEAGCAILLLSAELSELQALCDRILVMYRGKLVASLDNDPQSPVSREQLGELMAGVGTTVES